MGRGIRLLLLVMAFVATCAAQEKKRVAVLDFDYATVKDAASAVFGTSVDVGKGISDLIVEDLVKSGTYSVIERKALDKVLAEQNLSNSDRADANSAAKLGRVLGVDAIIIGSITQFGRDDKGTNVGAGALGGLAGRFGIGGVSKKESKAVVGVSARMVSTDTAEILGVAEGKGESKRSGTSLIGSGGSSTALGAAAYDMTSKNFGDTIMGEAVHQAVNALSAQLDQNAGRLPAKTLKVDGLVADATGGTLILNVGGKAGVKVGDHLQVLRAVREIKDPATGKVLRRVTDKVGEVVITEADETSSVGAFTGAGVAKVGDTVSNAP